MEEVERMSREAKEGKEEGRKVSPQGAKIRIAHQGRVDITPRKSFGFNLLFEALFTTNDARENNCATDR